MSLRQKIIKLEQNWNKEKVQEPTHLAVSMTDYLNLKYEVAIEENWTDEDLILKPLYTYEGLVVVVSENPSFGEPILLSYE